MSDATALAVLAWMLLRLRRHLRKRRELQETINNIRGSNTEKTDG